jgi:hypothetical protein
VKVWVDAGLIRITADVFLAASVAAVVLGFVPAVVGVVLGKGVLKRGG